MRFTHVVIIALVTLTVGFAGGFVLRPVLMPSASPTVAAGNAPVAGFAPPSEAEATAAVRRFRAGFQTFDRATLDLGECSDGGAGPGVTCMTVVTLRPGSHPQNRAIGFARVNGRWEVSRLE